MIKHSLEGELIGLIQEAARKIFPDQALGKLKDLYLEIPLDSSHGDLSSNFALRLGKQLKKNSRSIAESLKSILSKEIAESGLSDTIDKIQVEGPGFINFFIKDRYFYDQIDQIIKQGPDFGTSDIASNEKIQIEFVSANPTGPLSIAHARQAAVGDSLARIMESLGFRVVREYYLNDVGNQIDILGRSIQLRLRQLNDETVEFPEDHYQGDYIKDIAEKIIAKDRLQSIFKFFIKKEDAAYADYGARYILNGIKKDLASFGVKFDVWFSQKALERSGKIEKAIEFLRGKGLIHENDGAVWFKSSVFGDDKDRVVVKSSKKYTYLAPDIAYHKDKFERGFKRVINLWGPDHHGYIRRIQASVLALGYKKESLSIIIVQLVTLFRGKKPMPMSTRKGSYVTLRQVIDEIGKDVMRFLLVSRRVSSHLDFDLELAKKQSNENPAYYIQYAFARISSILRKADQTYLKRPKDLSSLNKPEELLLIRKLSQFPHVLKVCFSMLDPYPLTAYLSELSGNFHKFYDKHKVLDTSSLDLSRARIRLVKACSTVLRNGLLLLGLSSPEKM